MKLTLRDRWDDLTTGDRYVEIKIGKNEACCVKETANGLLYVMECADGNDIYSDIGGADFPLRTLTPAEREEAVAFAKEQFEVEKEMDEKEVLNAISPFVEDGSYIEMSGEEGERWR
jgi:hypothetical protein